MDLERAAGALAERALARAWGLAVAAVDPHGKQTAVSPGHDPLDGRSVFDLGSVTKTVTGLLLGALVNARELDFDTSLGELITWSGGAQAVTVRSLATHTSGLPRLPPNIHRPDMDLTNPYAHYTAQDLREGLAQLPPPQPGGYEYSNFGFMVLGELLAQVKGVPYEALVRRYVFDPLGLVTAGCPPPENTRLPGYSSTRNPKWWNIAVPGAGGIGMGIDDLATYLQAMCTPPKTLRAAVELVFTSHNLGSPTVGLAWRYDQRSGAWWSN